MISLNPYPEKGLCVMLNLVRAMLGIESLLSKLWHGQNLGMPLDEAGDLLLHTRFGILTMERSRQAAVVPKRILKVARLRTFLEGGIRTASAEAVHGVFSFCRAQVLLSKMVAEASDVHAAFALEWTEAPSKPVFNTQ